jgi:hypothetical protein
MENLMNKNILALAVAGALVSTPSAVYAAGNVMVTTVVENFEVTNGNIGCPKGPWGNTFAVNVENLMGKMDERSMEKLLALIGQFESTHGVSVESNTTVRNFETTSDKIRTSTTGPVGGIGAQLCALAGSFV